MKTAADTFDVMKIREDFPILHREVHRKPLVYLDNAATTQKPRQVIDAVSAYYSEINSNIHRGVHYLSEKATHAYEEARKTVQHFINAPSPEEIIFVRGTTEGINLVASSYGRQNIGEGDEIIVSAMEHHSNIVPWQMLCEEKKAKLCVIPINDEGEIIFEEFEKMLGKRTKLIAVTHVSNAIGTVNEIKKITAMAQQAGVPVLVDGAQAVPHLKTDVQNLGCDFYVFSGHKIYGPTGIGVLYGRRKLLERMPPWQGGGDMILSVTFDKTVFNALPYKFEAGTPHIAGATGLAAALDYVSRTGLEKISGHEQQLLSYATEKLLLLKGLRIIGTAKHKAAVVSFVIEGIHPHDIGTLADREGVAIRTGHHCAQPVMERFHVPATSRASFAFYNTTGEIDVLVSALEKIIHLFS